MSKLIKSIRVDIKYLEEQELIKRCREIVDLVDTAMIVIETAKITKKRHIQGMISYEDCEKLKRTKKIRNIIVNKLLDKQGKQGDYSLGDVKQYDNYMVYLSKGEEGGEEPEIIYLKNIDKEYIARYREQAVVAQENFKKSKEKKPNRNQEYIEWFKLNKLKNYETQDGYEITILKVIEDIDEFFHHKLTAFKDCVIEQYINLTYNSIAREYDEKTFRKWQQSQKQKLISKFIF